MWDQVTITQVILVSRQLSDWNLITWNNHFKIRKSIHPWSYLTIHSVHVTDVELSQRMFWELQSHTHADKSSQSRSCVLPLRDNCGGTKTRSPERQLPKWVYAVSQCCSGMIAMQARGGSDALHQIRECTFPCCQRNFQNTHCWLGNPLTGDFSEWDQHNNRWETVGKNYTFTEWLSELPERSESKATSKPQWSTRWGGSSPRTFVSPEQSKLLSDWWQH